MGSILWGRMMTVKRKRNRLKVKLVNFTMNYKKSLSKIKRIVILRNEGLYKKLKKWSFKMLRVMA